MSLKNSFFEFIKKSPTAFHAVSAIKDRLQSDGYIQLFEGDSWELSDGKGYFVIRSDSSLISFRYKSEFSGFMMSASHTDSPTFKIKPSVSSKDKYIKLDVEKYGGAIHYTWLDKPLSVAGRVFVKCADGVEIKLVDLMRDVAAIPSVALGMQSELNSSLTLNVAKDLQPLFSSADSEVGLLSLVAQAAKINENDIISHDLVLYNRCEPTSFGAQDEFILSPRIDDLSCVFSVLEGFLGANSSAAIPVIAVFDNEEIGSETKNGAASTFLSDILHRICPNTEEYMRKISNSFMVSADVAHAIHPNSPELSDRNNAPIMNGGVVIKYNANQRYATDGEAAAVFSLICERASVPYQNFTVRADKPCGSTIGHISSSNVSAPTVDVGIAQLSMHSATETCGAKDIDYLAEAMRAVYSSSILRKDEKIEIITEKCK